MGDQSTAQPSGAPIEDETILLTALTAKVDGGPGVDTLSFQGFQAVWVDYWTSMTESVTLFDMYDPVSNRSWSLEVRNVERLVGSEHVDHLLGNAQVHELHGQGGDDVLTAPMDLPFSMLIRGGAGADVLWGGDVFDDLHGNIGDDTVRGWDGGDWVVGGQGADSLLGDTGDDIIYGNLGSDTCLGGEGHDTVVAGQLDDIVRGEAGNDWLGGDRGADTLWGGAGADTFRYFAGAGVDKIMDFSAAEGDRILLEGGGAYSLSQSGSDLVISLGAGDQIILANVSQASFQAGWILMV